MQAAGRLFAEQGFYGTGLREVASAAGGSLHSTTYHFGTKEHLFAECVRDCLENKVKLQSLFGTPLPPAADPRAAQTAVAEKIVEVFRAFFTTPKYPWLGLLIVRAMVERVDEAQEHMHGLLMLARGWFYPALLQILPELADPRFALWHISLWGQISFYATAQPLILRRQNRTAYDPAFLTIVGRQIASGSLAALGLPPVAWPAAVPPSKG